MEQAPVALAFRAGSPLVVDPVGVRAPETDLDCAETQRLKAEPVNMPGILVKREVRCDVLFPGLPPATHDLRHSAASFAVSSGANVKAVQRMLGHSSAAMTLDVCADLFADDLDAVATALDNAVSAASVDKMWANPSA